MIIPNHSTKEEFMEYLENQLIPDLKEAGAESTAEDFEEALHWMRNDGRFRRMITDLRLKYEVNVEEAALVLNQAAHLKEMEKYHPKVTG